MNTRKAVLGLGVSAAVVVLLYWKINGQLTPRRLASDNYPRLQIGMTQAEVEELLGGPPGNYGHAGSNVIMTAEGYIAPAGCVEQIWSDDSNRFEIYFDAAGKVAGHHRRAGYSQPVPEGFLDWLRRMLGIEKEKRPPMNLGASMRK